MLSTQFAEIRKGLFSRKSLQLDIEKSDLIAIQVDREDTRLMQEQANAERRLTSLQKEERDHLENMEKALTQLQDSWADQFLNYARSAATALGNSPFPFSASLEADVPSRSCSISFKNTSGSKPLPKSMVRSGSIQISNGKGGLRFSVQFVEEETVAPQSYISLHEQLYILQEHITNAKNDLMNIRRQRANIGTMERKARVALATGILAETGPEGQELLKLLNNPQQPLPPASTGQLVGEVVVDRDPLNS